QQALGNLGLPIAEKAVKGMTAEALRDYLQFLGIPADLVSRFKGKTTSYNLFPILATRDGIVTAANVVPGETVDASRPLFVVSDSSRMWVLLSVRSEDVKYLRIRDSQTGKPGQKVRFRPDGSDQDVSGELVWKSTKVDDK